MKGCNTLTLCPAQMHEAVEFWLKNRLLAPEHAARVEVVRVCENMAPKHTFEVELREKEALPHSGSLTAAQQNDFAKAVARVEKDYESARAYYGEREAEVKLGPTSAAVERFSEKPHYDDQGGKINY